METNQRRRRYTKEEASKRLKTKIAIYAGTVILGAGAAAYGLTGCNKEEPKITTEVSTEQNNTEAKENYLLADETNPELKEIYKQLLEYSDGEELIKELQLIDNLQEEINDIAIANPDDKGKVSYILAEELAAIHDVYNANLDEKTILESEEIGRCYYFSGQANLINLSQGSKDVQEIDTLIDEDSSVKDYQEKLQTETQKTLDDYNIAPKSFKKLAKEIYSNRNSNPEAQIEMSFGQPGLVLALNNGLTGKQLKNYQEASKKEGTQANRLFKEAYSDTKKFSVEENTINIEKQKLINDALETMNEKNHTLEYDNTGYNPSTTKKGKEMIKTIVGDIAVDGSGEYYEVKKSTDKTTTTHTRKKITKQEATKKFGKKAVEKAEKKAEAKTKVDTNGDGKKDTTIPKANKKEQEKKQELQNDYPKGYKDGQVAFTNGGSSKASSGSSSYKDGYKDGYAHAKSVYDAQKKEDDKKKEEKFTPEPTTQKKETTTTAKKEETKEEKEIKPEEPPVMEEMHYESRKQVISVSTYINGNFETIDIAPTYAKSTSRVRS